MTDLATTQAAAIIAQALARLTAATQANTGTGGGSTAGAVLANGTVPLSAPWNAGQNITAPGFVGPLTGDASLDVKADGTRALTAGWNAGNFRIDSQNSTRDFNIVAYGADPTGAASSVAAINSAIAAMPANGGVLRAPTGTYLIDATITLSKSVTIIGDGGEAAATYLTRFLKKSTLAGPVFSVQASGVSLRDFYVDGNTGGGATGDGILIIGTSQMFTASRVTVAYNSATGWNMGNNTAAVTDDFKFDACISMLNGGHGWMLNSITPDTNGGTFIDCHALNNTGDGYQFLHAQFNAMFGGSAQSNGANGAHFMVGSAQNSIYGGDYELNVGSNILIDAAATTVSIFGILTSKITNNSVSTYGTNIFGDTILSTNAGANSLRLVGSGGATSISQFPTGAAAYLDNLAVSQATNFRSSNASSADTTWLTVSGPGVATFQKPLLAGTVIAESETNKALANGANENITVTSPFVYITGPTAVFSIGGVVATTVGQIVTFWNQVGFAMTVNHADGGSTAANQIRSSTGANVACGGTYWAWFTLQYSAAGYWILLGHS